MPPDHMQVATCHVCGATRNTDWMARVGNFDYCLPNGSVGSPGNVDHRPGKVPMTDHVSSPTTREPSTDSGRWARHVERAARFEADPRLRQHHEETPEQRSSWFCVPTTAAIEEAWVADAEAVAAPQARVRALREKVAAFLGTDQYLARIEQPAPERDGGLDAVCPKCGSREQRTYWHERSIATCWHQKVCSDRDASTQIGEHLHHYCQTCHFDWCHPIAASPTTPADPETPE